jgi:hypothetical protein
MELGYTIFSPIHVPAKAVGVLSGDATSTALPLPNLSIPSIYSPELKHGNGKPPHS